MASTTMIPTGQPQSSSDLKTAPPIRPARLVAFGILLVLLGGLAFASIIMATIVSVYFVAITMVLAGLAEISLGLRSASQSRKLTWVLLGILYVGAGLFALFNPLLAAGVLTLLLGASLTGTGVARLLLSFQMRSGNHWWWMAVSAVVTFLLGIMVLVQWPASSLYILGVFLSADLIFAGACWITIGVAAMSPDDVAAPVVP